MREGRQSERVLRGSRDAAMHVTVRVGALPFLGGDGTQFSLIGP